ncbi:MAG TPA: hypothetical protein PLH43_01815 [Acetivibrio sp.]|nr:hypothetical protein [Acetivibrio sp.]HOM01551.1 hypothetical protein [Acetivibrio sp.]
MKEELRTQKSDKNDKNIEMISYYDENGKSINELMQELIGFLLPT